MQDWYLITPNTRPNLTGGYENDAYNDYKDDEFAEILDTDIASTVELCNSDLSERTTIRCVVQDNDSDTSLKTMQRTVLFPCNTSKAGMYVYFENNYWIIDGRPGQCGVFEKTTMKLCQSTVKWQDADGNIHERWAYYQSASKYDVGKTGNNIIFVGSNNYTVIVPQDDDTLWLDGKRVFLDIREVPNDVFTFTRDDNVLYHFGTEHGGVLSFIVDKDEFNPAKDRKDLRLCDYFEPKKDPEPTQPEKPEQPDVPTVEQTCTATIKYRYKKVFVGKKSTFTASFKDLDGNTVTKDPQWDLECELKDSINIEETGSNIGISVSNSALVGQKIILKLSAKDGTSSTASIEITIESLT